VNWVQNVQAVSAKQFGADPSFGGQAGVTPIDWTVKGQKLEYRNSEFGVDSFSLHLSSFPVQAHFCRRSD
jgi:hypothetical protein